MVAEGYGEECEHEAVDKQAQDWQEEMHDEQDHFHQQDEHPKDGGGYVESGGAAIVLSAAYTQLTGMREHLQLTPYYRRIDGSVICVAVQHYAWVAVESMVCAILPEFRAVCVWVCDAEEGEHRNCEQELDYEESVHGVGKAPVSGYEESRHACGCGPVQCGQVSSGVCLRLS